MRTTTREGETVRAQKGGERTFCHSLRQANQIQAEQILRAVLSPIQGNWSLLSCNLVIDRLTKIEESGEKKGVCDEGGQRKFRVSGL